ncbi:hypothetical protein V8G54_001944, partial [Vigna mungo]
ECRCRWVGLGVTGSTLPSFSFTRSHTSTPNISVFFRSQSHSPAFRYFTRYNPHLHVVVTFDSKATSLDLTQPDFDHTGGGSDANGNSNGPDNSKGEEGSGSDKRKMALLMSQKFTLVYVALVRGTSFSLSRDVYTTMFLWCLAMGFLKSGNQNSLLAGGLSASLLYYVYTELPGRLVFASSMGLGK